MYVAIDRKDKKPKTSVKVVKIIPEAKAGSIFSLFIVKGIKIPNIQANPKLINIDMPTAKANIRLSNQKYAMNPIIMDNKNPLIEPIKNSLITRFT